MPALSSELAFADDFQRADAGLVANGWSTETADLRILNGVVRATTVSGDTRALILRAADAAPHSRVGAEYHVQADLAITNDHASGDTRGAIILRAQDTGVTNNCYMVRLKTGQSGTSTEDEWILSIVKVNAGTETILTSVTVKAAATAASGEIILSSAAVDAWKNVFQRLSARIRDNEDGHVLIEAFVNDEQRPRLSFEDLRYPLWRAAGEWGFEWYQRGDLVVLDEVGIKALNDQVEAPYVMVPALYTWGVLKQRARELALRDSKATVDDTFWGQRANDAEQALHAYVGALAWWVKEIIPFSLAADQEEVEFPPEVAYFDDTVRDTTSTTPLPVYGEAEFDRMTGDRSNGQPQLFRLGGVGAGGGPILRPYPIPETERLYSVAVSRRPPFMTADNQLPLTPQQYCPALIWGMVKDYSARDSDRTHIQFAATEWGNWLRRIRAECLKRQNRAARTRIVSGFWPSGRPPGGLRG